MGDRKTVLLLLLLCEVNFPPRVIYLHKLFIEFTQVFVIRMSPSHPSCCQTKIFSFRRNGSEYIAIFRVLHPTHWRSHRRNFAVWISIERFFSQSRARSCVDTRIVWLYFPRKIDDNVYASLPFLFVFAVALCIDHRMRSRCQWVMMYQQNEFMCFQKTNSFQSQTTDSKRTFRFYSLFAGGWLCNWTIVYVRTATESNTKKFEQTIECWMSVSRVFNINKYQVQHPNKFSYRLWERDTSLSHYIIAVVISDDCQIDKIIFWIFFPIFYCEKRKWNEFSLSQLLYLLVK